METNNKSARDEGDILIVDDDSSIRESLGGLLTACGFRVLVADSYESAIAILETAEKEIETILCDIKMPGKSGLDVLRYINAQGLGVPVIFLTGVATLDTCRTAVKEGALEYLLKPVDNKDDLLLSLRRGVDKYRMEKQHDQMQADIMRMADQHCGILDGLLSELESREVVLENLDKIVDKWKKPHSQDSVKK